MIVDWMPGSRPYGGRSSSGLSCRSPKDNSRRRRLRIAQRSWSAGRGLSTGSRRPCSRSNGGSGAAEQRGRVLPPVTGGAGSRCLRAGIRGTGQYLWARLAEHASVPISFHPCDRRQSGPQPWASTRQPGESPIGAPWVPDFQFSRGRHCDVDDLVCGQPPCLWNSQGRDACFKDSS